MDCAYCNNIISESRVKHGSNYCSVKCYTKGYYKDNNDTILIKAKKYRDDPKRKEKKELYMDSYRKNNKDSINTTSRKYWANHKERKKELDKQYKDANWDKIYARIKWRRAHDIYFKLADGLRTKIRKSIKNNYKFTSTMKLTDCTMQFLRQYLESKFKSGMTWKNHGVYGWHIDHIIPISSFDLTKEEDQRKCFHYTNLQPLWAEDNMKKGNKLNYDIDGDKNGY